jgi:TetR/AcrR family transcriptional regulator, copper-responsive repressor
MVQKSTSPRRGRPRAYDPEQALDAATRTFWRAGFTGTSLDDLTESTAMNRPSLYAAFGDKQALYLKTMERYTESALAAIAAELGADRPIAASLSRIYRGALDLYGAGESGARGCYLTGTSVAAAVEDAHIRAALSHALARFDGLFTARFARAQEAGELSPSQPAEELGALAMGVLHTLAIRTRAGVPRERLDALAEAAVATLCASAPLGRATARRRPRSKAPAPPGRAATQRVAESRSTRRGGG